jgi:hypothetical protein
MSGNARSWPFRMSHSLHLAVCSLCRYNIGEQSRGSTQIQPIKLRSVVAAQGAAYDCNGICRQWYESGI